MSMDELFPVSDREFKSPMEKTQMGLSTNPQDRKERPIARGVLDYFPDAIAEVANVSFVGNKQHNPGEEMHWAREKSKDHADCIARHLIERGTKDTEGLRHSAKIAWRALALLQIEIEADQKSRGNDNCRDGRSVYEQKHGFVKKPSILEGLTPIPQVPQDSAWQPVGSVNSSDGYPRPVHTSGYLAVASNPADSECARTLRDETDPHAASARYRRGSIWHRVQKDERTTMFQRLIHDYHCPLHVAEQIAGGTTFSYVRDPAAFGPFAYVAGPMRGHPDFNFPAFDAARNTLVAEGFNVISPADIDRAAGDDQSDDQAAFFLRDMFCLYFLKRQGNPRNKVHVLPEWEQSRGAAGEFFGGRWLGLKFSNNWNDRYDAETAKHDFALRNSMARA